MQISLIFCPLPDSLSSDLRLQLSLSLSLSPPCYIPCLTSSPFPPCSDVLPRLRCCGREAVFAPRPPSVRFRLAVVRPVRSGGGAELNDNPSLLLPLLPPLLPLLLFLAGRIMLTTYLYHNQGAFLLFRLCYISLWLLFT